MLGGTSHPVCEALLRVQRERDPELGVHSRTVANLAAGVGRRLRLSATQLEALILAGELHDVGKIALPDAILEKPSPLDPDEWGLMQKHTLYGEEFLAASAELSCAAKIVRASHERYDGLGYPDGLTGETIPRAARIIAACDAYVAMTDERPYARAASPDAAIAELRRCASRQFDPVVVEALCVELGA